MSNIGNAKLLGGIGAILSLVGGFFFANAGAAIGIVGLILIFIAIKYIADETKDKSIFNNYLYYFLTSVIATVVTIAIVAFAFLSTVDFNIYNFEQFGQNITDFSSFMDTFGNAIAGCALALIIGWVLLIIGTIFLKRSYYSIAEKTKVDMFKTTGLVYFIGAITLIIVIGFLILLIARIMEIIAFFSLPDNLPEETKNTVADDVK